MARDNHTLTTVRAASVPAAVSEARRQPSEALFTTDIEATASSDIRLAKTQISDSDSYVRPYRGESK